MRELARGLADVTEGVSCNQASFKAGKSGFFFVGPGAKGVGFKAMFKLDGSLEDAAARAEKEPDRYQVGKNGWVTVRFTAEKPMPKSVWSKWVKEAHRIGSKG